MAEKNFMRFIPPNLRGPLTDLGIFGRVAADNIYGLDDDYESTGEMLGTAFREDPVGLAKDLGTGIYEGAKDIYEDPKGAFEDLKTSLGNTIDRLNTPYDQLDLSTEEAQRQRAGDLMLFGEALGAGGVLTKGLVNLGKKQLKEKVIQENPGLNEDQVNSIVEDRGIDLDTFVGDPASEIDRAYNRGELVPIVTAGDRVIGGALRDAEGNLRPMERNPEDDLENFFLGDEDVDGNLYDPPDEVTLSEIIADQNAYFESLLDEEARFDRLGNELTDDADIIDRAIQIHSEEGFPDLDPDRERLIREELDRVLDAQRALDVDDPPEIEDLMEPPEVDEDELFAGFDEPPEDDAGLLEMGDPEPRIMNPYLVQVRGAVQQYLDDNNISLVDARDRLSRNQLGDSFPRDLAEFVGEQGITTPGPTTLSAALTQLEESVTPFGLNAEDVPDDLYDRLRDIVLNEPITEQQATAVRNLVTQTLNIDANTDMDVGGGAFDDTVDQIDQFLDETNPAREQNFNVLRTGQLIGTNQQGHSNAWLTAPGYERFAPDPTDDSPSFSTDAELAAGDIGLLSENSYLTSRMDKAISDLSQTQTKFASMEQLVNTLMNKYGVQLTELQARNIPTDRIEADLREGYSAEMFSQDKVDLKELIANRQLEDPFVVRTLGGNDVAYATNFTKGVQNYKETLIGLNRPELYNAGVKDSDHFMRHQDLFSRPTVVHIRTGEFPVALTADEMAGTTRQKAFHLGEIQSQVEREARDSRKSRNLILAFEEKVLKSDGIFNAEAEKIAEDSMKRIDLLRRLGRLIDNGAARDDAASGMKRLLDKVDTELGELNASYNIYDPNTGELVKRGGEVLTGFEDEFRNMLIDTKMERFGKFKRGDNIATPRLLNDVLKYANETNIDDIGVGSIYQTDRITRMGIKEALQQAVDTDAEFFTLGTGQMAKDMTYGKESGQKKYYDNIVPKTFNKIMEQLEKQNDVKLPRLEKRKIETLSQDGNNVIEQEVLGIEITDELRNLFRLKKVEAFKEGGLATLSSSLRPKLRPGTLESLREKMYLAGPPRNDRQMEEFANLEFEYDLKELLDKDPIAALGFDPTKTRYTLPQEIRNAYYMRGRKGSRYTQDGTYLGEEDDVVYGPAVGASEDIIVHEYRHRGHEILRDAYFEDKEGFTKKYGQDVVDFITGEFEEIADGPLYLGDRFEEFRTELGDNLNATFIKPRPNAKQIAEMFPDMAGVFSEEELEKMGQELYTQIVNQADEPYEISPELKQEFFNELVQGSVLEGTELVTKEDQEKYKGILSKVRQAASDILKERKGYERGGLVTLAKEVL